MLSMSHAASYRGRELMSMHHFCSYKPKTIVGDEPNCVEPTNKQMWCIKCVQYLEHAWCKVHHGNGLLKHIRLHLQGMLCGGVPSS